MNILIDFLRMVAGFMLQVLPYAILCLLPFSDKLRFKHGKLITFTFVCISAMLFSGCVIFIQSKVTDIDEAYMIANAVFMVLFCLCILYYCFIVKSNFASKIYVACYAATFAFFVSLFTTVIWQINLSAIFPIKWGNSAVYDIYYDIILFLATAIVFPFSYLLVKKQLIPTVKHFDEKEAKYFAYFSASLLMILAVSFAILDYTFIESEMAIALCLTSSLAVGDAHFMGSMLISKIRQVDELKIDLLTSKYNNDITTQQYNHIQENIDNQRMLRHNFRQQLITLRGLCEQNSADIRSYLNEYLDYIPDYEITPICQNAIFNSILNYYKTTAENKGFKFSCNINLPVCVDISEIDIITIIGNLLENAIDAGSDLPQDKRMIEVNIDFSNKMIGIAVDNSFNGNIKAEEGQYISTKHSEPAFGIKSINIIADKYNGNAVFTHKDNMFYSSVMLANVSKD